GAAGGAVALLMSMWALRLLYPLGVMLVPSDWGAVVLDVSPDLAVFVYTFGLALAAGAGMGAMAAVRASARQAGAGLREEGDGGMMGGRIGRSYVRQGLVVAQLAVCLTLLVGAGLLARGLQRARTVDLGFRADGVMFANLDRRHDGYTAAEAAAFDRTI